MDEFSIELKYMFDIINLNKDKLDMAESDINTHHILKPSIETILQNIENTTFLEEEKKDYKNFMSRLLDIMIYIDYDTFSSKIKSIASKINNIIWDDLFYKYDTIYLCASGSIKKSNTWVLLLILREIIKHFNNMPIDNTRIQTLLNKVKICTNMVYYYMRLTTKSKVLFIYCDDMIYSGTLAEKNLPRYNHLLGNTDIYLGVPYISISGLKKLQAKFPVKLFNSTTIIPSLEDLFVQMNSGNNKKDLLRLYEKYCSALETRPVADKFQSFGSMTPIYFDHKIGDYLSTFRKLLYFGIFPVREKEECKHVKLIDNCDNLSIFEKYNKHNNLCNIEDNNTKNIINDNEPNVDYETVLMTGDNKCPKNFYKNIKYTYYKEGQESLNLESEDLGNQITIITVPLLLKNKANVSVKSNKEYIKEWFSNMVKRISREKYLKYKFKYLKLKQPNES